MPKTRSNLATVIIVALALVLLFALNPTRDDFIAWRSGQAQREATGAPTKGPIGMFKKGAGAVVGAVTSLGSGGFKSHNFLICSSYSLGGELYLGLARLFVQLR
jgi:hypothetical protein